MTWITFSESHIFRYLAAPQVEALQAAALAAGQANPLPEIIADTAARVRNEIRGNPTNRVSAVATEVPPELIGAAAALAIEAAQTRLPGLSLTAEQIRLANDSRSMLRRVAAGTFPITLPTTIEDPDRTQRNLRADVVSSRARTFTRERMAGL